MPDPVLLKAYLDRFALTVQRYFPLPKESLASEFASIAERYPVFELTSAGMRRDQPERQRRLSRTAMAGSTGASHKDVAGGAAPR